MGVIFGMIGFLALLAFGIAQFCAGFDGIQQAFGAFWAWAAIAVALGFRFTLPITIGAFFGAMDVWDWHWALAALFAVPSLLLLIPSMIPVMIASLIKR